LALGFFAISIIFYIRPLLDIEVMKFFYQEGVGFVHAHNSAVKYLFRAVPILTIAYVVIIIAKTIYISIKDRTNFKKIFLHITVLLSLAVGSGVIVNLMLKDNFGRARPKQIKEFGALKEFSPVYQMSDQCIKNCSFSSGHAAAGFSFTTLAYLAPPALQLPIYFFGIIFGLLVGFGRILQGGHFLSDVLTSAWIVLAVNYVLFSIYKYFTR